MPLHARSMMVLLTIAVAAFALADATADALAAAESVAEPSTDALEPRARDHRARRASRFRAARHPVSRGVGMGGHLWAGGSDNVTYGLTGYFVDVTMDGLTVVHYGRLASLYCIVVVGTPACVVLTRDMARSMVMTVPEEAKPVH